MHRVPLFSSPWAPATATRSLRAGRGIGVAGLVFGLAVGTMEAEPVPADGLDFERQVIELGGEDRHVVLAGNLLGDARKELVAISPQREGGHRVQVHALGERGWRLMAEGELRGEVSLVDVARGVGRDRLLAYGARRLTWFNPAAGIEKDALAADTAGPDVAEGGLAAVDFTRDLDDDGRDDVVLPDWDGFWIARQGPDGNLQPPRKLGPAEPFADHRLAGERRRLREEGLTAETIPWLLERVHGMDHDGDGLRDLVFMSDGTLEVHAQERGGGFHPVARLVSPGIAVEADGVYARQFDYAETGTFRIMLGIGRETERRLLYSLRDVNGDGVADLTVLTLAGRGLAKQRSTYAVHFGRRGPDGLAFAEKPGAVLNPRGVAGAMKPWGYSSEVWADFDGDGRPDVLFRDVPTRFTGMVRTLVARSVPVDLEVFRGGPDGFGREPAAVRRVRPVFRPFGGGVYFPPILVGDVTGDGRQDLVVGHGPEELGIYAGEAGGGVFAGRPQCVAVELPDDERDTWLADLDADGCEDVVVVHPPGAKPARVVVLLAR